MAGSAAPDWRLTTAEKAFLAFEDDGALAIMAANPISAEASEIASLLLQYRIPIVILNACQSGKQSGASETSLAAKLLEAGAQTVLGMGYSVTVSAAEKMIPELYRRLFDGKGARRSHPGRAAPASRRQEPARLLPVHDPA